MLAVLGLALVWPLSLDDILGSGADDEAAPPSSSVVAGEKEQVVGWVINISEF